MSRPSSTSASALAFAVCGALVMVSTRAAAQACCAGSGAVTPGRLAVHEDALVGLQARAAHAFGSFDSRGHYSTPPPGSSEQDFEQDAIGALRMPVVDRAQLAVLVPLVETRRTARGVGEFGGGLGDVNASARYDFLYAGQNRVVPGIGALIGITLPTGRPPESATQPLATDATGIGAFQVNAGLAIEQLWDGWLITAYGIVAKRTSRTVQGIRTTLGTQWTALGDIQADGTGELHFRDTAVQAGARYSYRLAVSTKGGPVEYVGQTWIAVPAAARLSLRAVSATQGVSLSFTLSRGDAGTIELFDISGRSLESLRVTQSGSATVGRSLHTGVYLVKLAQGGRSVTQKVAVVR